MKIGDKVKIKFGPNPWAWVDSMDQYIGKVAIILEKDEAAPLEGKENKTTMLFLDIDNKCFMWSEDNLIPFDGTEEVKATSSKEFLRKLMEAEGYDGFDQKMLEEAPTPMELQNLVEQLLDDYKEHIKADVRGIVAAYKNYEYMDPFVANDLTDYITNNLIKI